MLPKLAALWERLRTSLWFLPGLMIAAAVVSAWIAVNVEIQLDASGAVWWINQGSAEEASNLLSSLLGSLITMATLVISITMVVLTLAAGQLGPRLIRSFVADWRTQGVVGLFISTIVYMLLVFRLLDGDLDRSAVPHFAVTLATALVFACLMALLYYVHFLSRSIVADTVVNRVGAELDRAVRRDLPDATGDPPQFERPATEPPAGFGLPRSGYVQAIDHESLARAAAGRGALVELLIRPGHHVLKGREHALVWPASALDEDFGSMIAGTVLVGDDRTAHEDIEFSVRQLVEIALRALSAGINDPFTAIAAIDRLAASLALAMERGDAPRIWLDEQGGVRVVAAAPTFEGIADLAFDQIRQAAAGMPAVLIRLADTLGALVSKAADAKQSAILARHIDKVRESGSCATLTASDLAELERRCRAASAKAAGSHAPPAAP